MSRIARAPMIHSAMVILAGMTLSSTNGRAEVSFSGQAPPPDYKLVLWYTTPATN
jgi:hypothetical protein